MLFDQLDPHLWGDDTATPYASIAEALNMTAVSVRVTVHRLRKRFHELLRAQIADTVEKPDDIEEELCYLRRLDRPCRSSGVRSVALGIVARD
jgi:RNA polymerase sigma-70 factor (ECF subfamily)